MRRAGAAKREVLPDPKYGSRLVAKFVNIMMIRGKKSTAERIMYDALVSVEDRSKQDALKMFKSAIDNVKPAVEVKSRRVGGSTYQVPVEVRPDRRTSWRCGGSSGRLVGAPSGAWPTSSPPSCSTPPAIGAPR